MDELQSGRKLCDQFFEDLINREDVDQKTMMLLKDLYSGGNLTADNILQGLTALRMEQANAGENQD